MTQNQNYAFLRTRQPINRRFKELQAQAQPKTQAPIVAPTKPVVAKIKPVTARVEVSETTDTFKAKDNNGKA